MARPCQQCGSKLHDTKVHKFWKEHDKPHSCLDDDRVKAVIDAYQHYMDENGPSMLFDAACKSW